MAEGGTAADASADAAYGALLGACVGDAAGAVLEFLFHVPTAEDVNDALTMPGGGVWAVAPGQITDDSELALCLAQALKGHAASAGDIPLDEIAHWYGKWLNSPPFDIGDTTRAALQAARKNPDKEGLGARMQQTAAQFNQQSLSNGGLMRITPMAIWSHKLGLEGIAAAAAADTSLTHPNKIAQVASGAYCIAIATLINHPRDSERALTTVKSWLQQGIANHEKAEQPTTSSHLPGGSEGPTSPSLAQQGAGSCQACPWSTVQDWLLESQQEGPGPDVEGLAGFMKWGFVHAFRALRLKLHYEEAIRHVLSLGGDTDTNAAIVGGLIGAYWGAASIPASMKDAVSTCNTANFCRDRPEFLQTRQLPALFTDLYRASHQ